MSGNGAIGSVAIIGAGIAGLSCARVLADHGISVTVFEKSRGAGGRMSTRRGSTSTNPGADHPPVHDDALSGKNEFWQCDHGAQYFTARHPSFIEQVRQWQQAGVVAQWWPRLTVIGERRDEPVAGRDITPRYVGIPGMTAPVRQLASGVELIPNARVTTLKFTVDGWVLEFEGDTRTAGPFKYLVLAIPAQQAAELLTMSAGGLHHGFPIEAVLSSCHQHVLRPCWALMMRFPYSHAEHSSHGPQFDAAFINPDSGQKHIISWIARDDSKPGRLTMQGSIWIAHATPAWSEQHLESEQQWIAGILLSEFRRITGIQAETSSFLLHRWRFAQTVKSGSCPGQLWFQQHSLGLCGDWLNGGRVEGAWLSGHQLAHTILLEN